MADEFTESSPAGRQHTDPAIPPARPPLGLDLTATTGRSEPDLSNTREQARNELFKQGYRLPNEVKEAEKQLALRQTVDRNPLSLLIRTAAEMPILGKGHLTPHARDLYEKAIKEAEEVRAQGWVETDLAFKKELLEAKQEELDPKLHKLKEQIQRAEKQLSPEKRAELEYVRGEAALAGQEITPQEWALFSPHEKKLYVDLQRAIAPLNKLMDEIAHLEEQQKLPEYVRLRYAEALYSNGDDQDKAKSAQLFQDVYMDPRNDYLWAELKQPTSEIFKRFLPLLEEFGINRPL